MMVSVDRRSTCNHLTVVYRLCSFCKADRKDYGAAKGGWLTFVGLIRRK